MQQSPPRRAGQDTTKTAFNLSISSMIHKPENFVIVGRTSDGRTFRPSDWAERLSGILSSFGHDHRMSYSPYVRPMTVDNVKCVAVDKKLQEVDMRVFNFLMAFAKDNDLRVVDCKTLQQETTSRDHASV